MKKAILVIMICIFAALFIVGCEGEASGEVNNDDNLADQNTESENVDVDEMDDGRTSVKIDVDGDLDADVGVVTDGDTAEVTVEMDKPEDVKMAIENATLADICVAGETYTYAQADSTVDAEIQGIATFKGEERCEAIATTVIESPIGQITTTTTYYYDVSLSDFWLIATTSGASMPTQTNEIHIIDGEVVN